MLFKSSVNLFIYTSILFINQQLIHSNRNILKRFKRDTLNYKPKCIYENKPIDQVLYFNKTARSIRKKRFILFPEFINYIDDWRYINRPREIFYWIANFYPNRINTEYLHRYIKHIIQQINTVIDNKIIIHEASNPGQANFHFNLFDYTKCPMDDIPEATIDNVQIFDKLLIYSSEVVRKSRYRAHGGIHLVENNRPISTIKLNMQQTFVCADDLVYEPIKYTCVVNTNLCEMDLYYTLLHEMLHGFGIEVLENFLSLENDK